MSARCPGGLSPIEDLEWMYRFSAADLGFTGGGISPVFVKRTLTRGPTPTSRQFRAAAKVRWLQKVVARLEHHEQAIVSLAYSSCPGVVVGDPLGALKCRISELYSNAIHKLNGRLEAARATRRAVGKAPDKQLGRRLTDSVFTRPKEADIRARIAAATAGVVADDREAVVFRPRNVTETVGYHEDGLARSMEVDRIVFDKVTKTRVGYATVVTLDEAQAVVVALRDQLEAVEAERDAAEKLAPSLLKDAHRAFRDAHRAQRAADRAELDAARKAKDARLELELFSASPHLVVTRPKQLMKAKVQAWQSIDDLSEAEALEGLLGAIERIQEAKGL